VNIPPNLLANLPDARLEEITEVLAKNGTTRIERVTSQGQASPPGFWYDQDEAEWVAVLTGRARLLLQNPDEEVELSSGDWLQLAPHRRHRIEWTTPDAPTVWLAVFYAAA